MGHCRAGALCAAFCALWVLLGCMRQLQLSWQFPAVWERGQSACESGTRVGGTGLVLHSHGVLAMLLLIVLRVQEGTFRIYLEKLTQR